MSKTILIVTQYFWPEEFRVNDLAIDLVSRGYEVTVLTGNPNYPEGDFFEGYGYSYTSENYKNIKIYRVPIFPRKKYSFSLVLNYLSFVITGSIFSLFHNKKYDQIFSINFSPITAVIPAIIFKKRYKVKHFLWVQDLWPESVTAAGKINSGFLINILNKVVKWIYKNSDKILVQSKGFVDSIKEKGINEDKIDYMPNWAEDLYSDSLKIDINKFKEKIPSGFVVMFAGNIGEAQDFESIINAAVLTKNYTEIKWVFIGDGRKKKWLINEILKRDLQDTVKLIGRHPMEDMPSFFVHSKLLLLSLKDEKIFTVTIPSKVQSYMAFGKPIVGMLNGIGAKVIDDAKCGYTSKAGDYQGLAKNVITAYQANAQDLQEKGKNSKKYYLNNFSKKVVIDSLIKLYHP